MSELTKKDIIAVLNIIQNEFPRNKEADKESLIRRCELWYTSLKQYRKEDVEKAVYEAIQTSEFEPRLKNILDIIQRNKQAFTVSPKDLWNNEVYYNLRFLYQAAKDLSGSCGYGLAWDDYTQALSKETYTARGERVLEEVFERLSPISRRYFGNDPYQYLKLYNMSDAEFEFEKARFMKVIPQFITEQATADRTGQGEYYERLTVEEQKKLQGGKK